MISILAGAPVALLAFLIGARDVAADPATHTFLVPAAAADTAAAKEARAGKQLLFHARRLQKFCSTNLIIIKVATTSTIKLIVVIIIIIIIMIIIMIIIKIILTTVRKPSRQKQNILLVQFPARRRPDYLDLHR